MYCKKCGAVIEGNPKFCMKCGTDLEVYAKAAEGGTILAENGIQKNLHVKAENKRIDINAHVTNLSYEISADKSKALISFENLGFGVVTALKLNARGFTNFGDVVQIAGQDNFQLIIQDIKILKNATARNLVANLPSNEIRRLELEECQVCYSDGSVLTYKGSDIREFEVKRFDFGNSQAIAAIRKEISNDAKILPQDFQQGWLCSCERWNSHELSVCSKCGVKKEEIFKITQPEYVDKLIAKSVDEKEKARKKSTKIFLGVALVAVLLTVVVCFITASNHVKYSSVDEMKRAIKGTYTYYDDYGDACDQVQIRDDKITYKWINYYSETIDEEDYKIDSWDYNHGIIHTEDGNVIIKSQQELIYGGFTYKRGGYLSAPDSTDYTSYNYETVDPIEITLESLYPSYGSYICKGYVTNNSNQTYTYIKVVGSFKNASGNSVDKDWTYAVGAEGLAPGESSPFKIYVDYNPAIESVEVSLME